MACLWRPRSASSRAQSASSSVERRWQQGLVRPRHRCNRPRPAWRGHEITSCSTIGKLLLPWVQLPKHPLHLKKLASSTRKVLKSFWGVIPTKVGCQKPPPRMEIVSDAQGARSSRHVTSISQASDLCCQFYACLSWKPKPPAKIYLKRKYLNPKASAANLRQYAANTLPKNPAVADLVQHGEDMKSSLARPLENYFCLGLNLQMTCSTSKNSQARPEKRSNHSGA